MGYVLVGGPRDGEFADEVPEGYVAQGINAGIVAGPEDSPVMRAVWEADRIADLAEMNRIIDENGYRSNSPDPEDIA